MFKFIYNLFERKTIYNTLREYYPVVFKTGDVNEIYFRREVIFKGKQYLWFQGFYIYDDKFFKDKQLRDYIGLSFAFNYFLDLKEGKSICDLYDFYKLQQPRFEYATDTVPKKQPARRKARNA